MKAKTFISRLIYKARIQLDISQSELAKSLGLTRSAISRYENGNRMPSIHIINQLKRMLDADDKKTLAEIIIDQSEEVDNSSQSRAPPKRKGNGALKSFS